MQCGQFLSHSQGLICGFCLAQPPLFDKTYALFHYQPPIMQCILRLKFQGNLMYAQTLAQLFIQRMSSNWYREEMLPDLIIPVPLHTKRLKERGFNQALEIAKPIAKTFNIQIDKLGIKRTKATAAQTTLKAALRECNLANAFMATKRYDNLSIAIVDDVITTTYTVRELAKTLKQAGAEKITIWAIARR